jgi:hypothetical protein
MYSNILQTNITKQTDLSGNASDLYSWSFLLDSRLGHCRLWGFMLSCSVTLDKCRDAAFNYVTTASFHSRCNVLLTTALSLDAVAYSVSCSRRHSKNFKKYSDALVIRIHVNPNAHRKEKICTSKNYKFYFITLLLWPPLWSSGQSSWLQIRRPGFDSRH